VTDGPVLDVLIGLLNPQ